MNLELINVDESRFLPETIRALESEGLILNANTIISIINKMNEIYDDNWDIEFISKDSFDITIRFKEFEITNSKGYKHTIKELFFKIKFNKVFGRLDYRVYNYLGTRNKISIKEHYKGYAHSHLNTRTIRDNTYQPRWSSFCTGTNTPLDAYIRYNIDKAYEEDKFEEILLHIMAMVRWESLEGVPHTKIQYVIEYSHSSSSPISVTNNGLKVAFRELLNFIISNPTEAKEALEFDYNEKGFFIKETNSFIKLLEKVGRIKDFMGYKHNGKYYRTLQNNVSLDDIGIPRRILNFRGESLPFEVYSDNDMPEPSKKKEIEHRVVKYIKNRINNEINKLKYRESAIK